jgi:hypothetical protein
MQQQHMQQQNMQQQYLQQQYVQQPRSDRAAACVLPQNRGVAGNCNSAERTSQLQTLQ